MGGIKNVYLRGSASLFIAQGSQLTGEVYFDPGHDFYDYSGWVVAFQNLNPDSPSPLPTVSALISELTATEDTYKFLHIATQRTGATVESTLQTSDSGAQYYRHIVTLPLTGLTKDAANLLYQIQGADLQVLVETWGGKWLLLGTEEPAKLTGNTGTTGGTYGDMPGNTVQITYESKHPLPVDPIFFSIPYDGTLEEHYSSADVIKVLKGIGFIVD